METNRLNHYFQIVGGIAVIVGLALVVAELRQTASLTRAELAVGSRNNIHEILSQVSSGGFSTTYAKMIENPKDLTTSEMLEADAFLKQIVGVILREVALKGRGIFQEDERIAKELLEKFFSNPYAQSWWSAERSRVWNPRVVELVDQEIPNLDVNGNMQNLARIQADL